MFDFLLPSGVSSLAAAAVIALSAVSAALTAAFGLGGGLMLLAVMGAAFPPAAVIPVHGVAQLGANASRFALLRAHAHWGVIGWFVLGGVFGATLGARVVVSLSPGLVRAGVGAFILAAVWLPTPRRFNPGAATYAVGGAATSFLTLFFGATGPFVAALVAGANLSRLALGATHAAAMTAQHGLKTLAFGAVGFDYSAWAGLIALILGAGFIGSWVGARALRRMGEPSFRHVFKAALSAVAAYLIVAGLAEAR